MEQLILSASQRAEKYGYTGYAVWGDGRRVRMSLHEYSQLDVLEADGSVWEPVKRGAA